jgi:hypothetical protein
MNKKQMEESAIMAQEMQEILTKKLNGKSVEYAFKVGNMALSSLTAGFIDALFKNAHPDKKFEFLDELFHFTKMILHSKNLIRDNNAGEKH